MNAKYVKDFIRAGMIAREVRSYGKSLIQKDASYNTIISKIIEKINVLGAKPAFPPQMALNEVAAHYLPMPDADIVFSDELIKLDVGICVNGAIGDCAVTVDLSGKHQIFIDAAEAALLAAESIIRVGLPIREIGKIIEETAASFGLKPIKNLSGHGLGYNKIHTTPTIPNYDDCSSAVIKPGMTFAIEPFVTNGHGLIYESGKPAIFMQARPTPARSPEGRALLDVIKPFIGLPFSIHELVNDQWPFERVLNAIQELLQARIIDGFPPLIEKNNGMVAQAENSVLVDEKGSVFITTR